MIDDSRAAIIQEQLTEKRRHLQNKERWYERNKGSINYNFKKKYLIDIENLKKEIDVLENQIVEVSLLGQIFSSKG